MLLMELARLYSKLLEYIGLRKLMVAWGLNSANAKG